MEDIKIKGLNQVLAHIQGDFKEPEYDLAQLYQKYASLQKPGLTDKEQLSLLTKAAVELTTQEAPGWEMIAARLLYAGFRDSLEDAMKSRGIRSFYEKIVYLTKENLYGSYILEHYSRQEIEAFAKLIEEDRSRLFTYSGLDLLLNRYVIRTRKGVILETPQEMFMGISMHLAMKEKENRSEWVKRFYDMLSLLKVTMATPTLSNARKPYHQLSSCFIDTVPDSLDGIYRSIDSFAKVSKYGGGMGMYFGKVRAGKRMTYFRPSAIRTISGKWPGII